MTNNNDVGLFLLLFGSLGLWIIIRPTAAIALAKHAHRNLRDRDPNTTSVVRFIGAWFIGVAVLLLVGLMMSPT
jgi:uncharacterized membrane protein